MWSYRKLNRKKLSAVVQKMRTDGVDAWLVFTREVNQDPLAEDFGLSSTTWRSAGILTADKEMTAIVGSLDVKKVERAGIYDNVYGYGSEGASDLISSISKKKGLRVLAINCSEDYPQADGLSSSMKQYLARHMKNVEKFVSSEDLIIELCGRLLSEEVTRVRKAVKLTEELLDDAQSKIMRPGKKDKEVFEYLQKKTRALGAGFSWPENRNPSLCVGNREPQHSSYDNVTMKNGNLLRIDFGIEFEGYCSDIQRVYYFGTPPKALRDDFEVARVANNAAIKMLKPSSIGYEVDRAGREIIIENGFPNYMHALGHVIARTAHEIGPLLAPRWRNRYGHAMEKKIGKNLVFAIEPTVLSKFGGINLEQDVLVNNNGFSENLSRQQEEIISL